MRHIKILCGEAFDWKVGKTAMDNTIASNGEVNWGAAICADPGIMQCPKCGEYYWREGEKVECVECGTIFEP